MQAGKYSVLKKRTLRIKPIDYFLGHNAFLAVILNTRPQHTMIC